MTTVEFVVCSFAGAWRCRRLFESVYLFDQDVTKFRWTVYEDPSTLIASKEYKSLPSWVDYVQIPTWSNMHGAARYAFDRSKADWAIYLGDDVLVTPGALSNLVFFLEQNELATTALVQPAYWNAHELSEEGRSCSDRVSPKSLLKTKEDMYVFPPEWILQVPRNPHWDGDGFAQPYINVNGVGFACRTSTYRQVGGFGTKTWCLDESISHKIWSQSDMGIVCLPGPPLVHYFGASTLDNPPRHEAHTEERWVEEFGAGKTYTGSRDREVMEIRRHRIEEEMRRAKYWRAA